MKRLLIILVVCSFLLSMPVGLSECGCGGVSKENQPANKIVGDNDAAIYPIEELCGLVEPEDWQNNAQFDPMTPIGDLPTSFDWRDVDGVDYTTPVKSQGSCGSCWAFGTVAPLECNILIHDGVEVDLSEQWLVSCNQDGWGCQGGWFAHDYFEWKTDLFNGTGAVLEEEFPYAASNVPCNGPYQHDYLIDGWKYIGGSWGVPSVEAMKKAIMDYGPISVAVAVNSEFANYNGGVFNGPSSSEINHAVALVGWDDSQGSDGVWFLRNSWGPGWGEDGYMRIEYGVCDVGYAACYIKYPVSTKVEINGGPGVIVGIRDVGDEDLNDVEWSISVEGGLLGGLNRSLDGTIPYLEPNTVFRKILPAFGLGLIKIAVTVESSNAAKVTKTADGFTLFGIVLPLFNQ